MSIASCERARKFSDKIRRNAICRKCGKQPVHYHDPTFTRHNDNEKLRISDMVKAGRSPRDILFEILKCVPLCRGCHVKEHFREKSYNGHCIECGSEDTRTKKMCNRCYIAWRKANLPRKKRLKKVCIDCGKRSFIRARKMCYSCYREWTRINRSRKCSECGEKKIIHARNMCSSCYSRWESELKYIIRYSKKLVCKWNNGRVIVVKAKVVC